VEKLTVRPSFFLLRLYLPTGSVGAALIPSVSFGYPVAHQIEQAEDEVKVVEEGRGSG